MAQTPQQRRANIAYAKSEASKRGKPAADVKQRKDKPQKSPISQGWIFLMIFVICGGVLVELIRIIAGFGSGMFG